MNASQQNKCHAIIHGSAVMCSGIGAGLAQLPGSDSVAIIPIQIGMTISLGAVFGIELNESTAKSSLATATATMIGRGISQALLGWVPIAGNSINAVTAFAITESIGWSIAKDFSAKQLALPIQDMIIN